MNLPHLSLSLPLLTKDLIEQSARQRTYVLRVVYAVILYGAALWVYADIAGGGVQSGIANLGRGRELFRLLVGVQFYAIILLLPAISCGAITIEKEQDTLGLLLLTKLSPFTIVLEKLFSRLVTIGTYQLLSLPLFAVIYGMGGVELSEIVAAILLLMCVSILVGAWSIACSTWYRTTTAAFLATYAMMPIAVCVGAVTIESIQRTPTSPAAAMVGITAFTLFVAGVTTRLASAYLVERAFLPPRNLLLEQFKKLDAFFERLNQQTTRGVMLVREHDYGPVFDPVAWRETRKKSLGTVRYLFRLLVLLEAPLALAIGWVVSDTQTQSFDGPTALFLTVLWPIAAVAIVVHTTNVLASERSRQTLDVLLVTPLSREELVTQKLAGVRRLIGVLTVPFATLLVFQTVWNLYVVQGLNLFRGADCERVLFLHEILGMALAMIVYPRVIQWIAFHVAMRLKNQPQAVLTSLAMLVGLCGFPVFLTPVLAMLLHIPSMANSIGWLHWLSPIFVLFHRQLSDPRYWCNDPKFLGLGLNAVVMVGLWLFLRYRALRCFSDRLGRAEPARNAA